MTGYTSAKIYVQGPDPELDLAIDQVSLIEMSTNTSVYRQSQDTDIDRLRKSSIHVK